MRCDLHMHSSCSDGALPPREIVAEARRASLDCIALTDHDTMAGVPEALAAAANGGGAPLRVLWACEVTTSLFDREVHVLAYFLAQPDQGFESFLVEARAARFQRIATGITRLQEQRGLAITLETVERHAAAAAAGKGGERTPGGTALVLSRLHVAQALVAAGAAGDTKAAFERYLGDSCGLFPHTTITPAQACTAITAAGGVPVWAHPEMSELDRFLDALVGAGIAGVESTTRRRGHVPAIDIAAQARGLLLSGGSDWHGYGRPPSQGDWHVPAQRIRALLDRLGVA